MEAVKVQVIKPNTRIEIDVEKLTIAVYNAGWDYTSFANEANISYSTFNRIMRGKVTKPKSQTIKDICRVLKIEDVREILKVKQKKKPDSTSKIMKEIYMNQERREKLNISNKAPEHKIELPNKRLTLREILGDDFYNSFRSKRNQVA